LKYNLVHRLCQSGILAILALMTVLMQISSLFFLMAVGFIAGKKKFLDASAIKGISALIIKVTLPTLILMSLQKSFSKELLGDALKTLFVSACFYVLVILLSYLAVRLLKTPIRQKGVFVFALSFSNCGFIGFPVVASILGKEALFLTAMHNTLFNILAFSLGILIVSGGASGTATASESAAPLTIKQRFGHVLNNNVLAVILGFSLFLLSVSIPRVLALPLGMLGELTTPLAMIATGAMLARTKVGAVLGNWRLYAVTLLRLALWPLITALVLGFAGITGQLYYISIIIAGMPAGSNTSLIAEVYGGDTDTASAIVFMTTLFSVVSIPILALLIK
jgi:predicted permease